MFIIQFSVLLSTPRYSLINFLARRDSGYLVYPVNPLSAVFSGRENEHAFGKMRSVDLNACRCALFFSISVYLEEDTDVFIVGNSDPRQH
jgi:hypothetical protein